MDFRQIIALILAIVGVVGSILPVLPGVILSLIAMAIIQWLTDGGFSTQTRVVSLILVIIAMVSDYLLPIRGAKRGGGTDGSKYGSIIGLIVGLFIPPWGLIVGPLLGAYVGEYLVHQDSAHARRAAWGSFVGSTLSSIIKVIAAGTILWFVIKAV